MAKQRSSDRFTELEERYEVHDREKIGKFVVEKRQVAKGEVVEEDVRREEADVDAETPRRVSADPGCLRENRTNLRG